MKLLLFHRIATYFYIFFSVFSLILLSGCSSEKTNFVAVTYHNTTAHFNAYYIARNRINEIEQGIINSRDDDYDKILQVRTPLDSSIAETYSVEIEDALKKASLAIQNHGNSKWVDDSYNLVGVARLLGHEHEYAIETFKYVNTNSKDEDARNYALLGLFRTFIEYGEYNNALTTSDYLSKRELNKDHLKELYLQRAYFYHLQKDYDKMVQNLVLSVPLLKKKDEKARIYFIIGQVYQELGFDSQAFDFYRKCLGSNPPYELSFYSKLYMARVSRIDRTRDIKNIRKDLEKLVKDEKNQEFVDKIYYEWAEFELNQGNQDEAIDLYNKSIQSSSGNARQKGLSYWKLGIIYYENLKDYELAKSYYDSSVNVMPKTNENYETIQERQVILEDFVEQLNIIHNNDSLLQLSILDSASLMDYIDTYLEEERIKEEAKALEEKKKKRKNGTRVTVDPFADAGGIGTTGWYFNNPSALSLGRSEFIRIWGNRPLEDNWRRSVKSASATFETDETASTTIDESLTEGESEQSTSPSEMNREDLYSRVPKTVEERMALQIEIKDALYKLGTIYNFNLEENSNAISTFEKLLERFPGSEYEPEVLYQLYLLYPDQTKSQSVKNTLLDKYPESTYAKLILNPNYQEESNQTQEILKDVYTEAYQLFQKGNYNQATYTLNQALTKYPDNPYSSRLELLKILIVGKTQDLYEYQLQLTSFIEKYQEEEIAEYAQTLLDASEDYKKGLIKLKDAEYLSPKSNDTHYMVISLANTNEAKSIESEIESFNQTYEQVKGLETGPLNLDDARILILVKEFDSKESALYYFDMFRAEGVILSKFPDLKFNNFVITESNFEMLYKTKELENYLAFYNDYY